MISIRHYDGAAQKKQSHVVKLVVVGRVSRRDCRVSRASGLAKTEQGRKIPLFVWYDMVIGDR